MIEKVPYVLSQHSLIGVDSGFQAPSISEFQPLGLISALHRSQIGEVSDDTRVSQSDDKLGYRQQWSSNDSSISSL